MKGGQSKILVINSKKPVYRTLQFKFKFLLL